jgi:predicted enzyme related to lactoylglutathione lyase
MRKTILVSVLLALLVAGCATVAPDLPAITDSPGNERTSGRVIWHDLITDTPEASRAFYGELFGWEFEKPPSFIGFGKDDSYMLIRNKGELIGGMLDANILRRDVEISQWVTVMSVADLDAAVGRVEASGGEVLTAPTDVGSRGTMAVVAGPDKAIIGLLQTREGDPAETTPEINGWLWNELWTDDVEAATSFYGGITGLQHDDRALGNGDTLYRMLMDGAKPRAGIMANPFSGALPVWVNYLRVEDPAAVVARVESLGGRVIVPPQPRDIGGIVAFVAGPSGAGIALQTWPLEQGDSD